MLLNGCRPSLPAHAEFGYDLETPASGLEVFTVSAIGEVVVEDRGDCFGRLDVPGRGRDVDPFVGVLGNEFCARFTKGSITVAM